MARVAGVDLPRNKRMEIALTYLFGVGKTKSREILTAAGVSFDKRSDDLDDNETRRIREVIEQMQLKIEGDLRREIAALEEEAQFSGQAETRYTLGVTLAPVAPPPNQET